MRVREARPLRNPEAGPIAGADAQPAVGEGMSACP